jgi:hypothetical protein
MQRTYGNLTETGNFAETVKAGESYIDDLGSIHLYRSKGGRRKLLHPKLHVHPHFKR